MVGFLVKKVFFDIWDNFISIVIMNLGYLIIASSVVLASCITNYSLFGSYILFGFSIFLFSFYSLGVSSLTFKLSQYKKPNFQDFKNSYKNYFSHLIVHFMVCLIIFICLCFVVPFYFSIQNMIGICFGTLLLVFSLSLIIALQFYFPICFYFEKENPVSTLKKSLGMFADNLGVSFFLFLRSIFDIILTIFTATLIPGITGISLSRMDTTRLLVKKYEFLSKNNSSKKDLNWEELLEEEKQLLGPRSLKNMFFPWKD